MSQDPLAGGREVTTQPVGFNKVGDFIKGVYTGKKFVESKGVHLYELKGIVGEYHQLDDNKAVVEPSITIEEGVYYTVWGGKNAIDDLFGKAKVGEVLAIRFENQMPSKTKGNNPFKVFKTLTFGMDPNYMGEDSSSQGTYNNLEDAGLI